MRMVTQTGGREMEERIDWYRKDVEEVLARLESQGEGLTAAEAQRRLSEFGYNKLIEKKKKGALAMFLGQFTDFMILILLAAAVVSAFLGEGIDSLAIILIVILNAILGFSQEYRAEKAMEALKAMSAPEALLLREGQTVKIPAPEIVPGDVVLLEAGNIIPADLRIIESVRIKADEASLTGESIPVEKTAKTLHDKHLPLGDRKNMAFMGTAVTYGRGKGIAVETGMKTEFGRIASMLQEEK
jgi:Ca2+-transporting ATPase